MHDTLAVDDHVEVSTGRTPRIMGIEPSAANEDGGYVDAIISTRTKKSDPPETQDGDNKPELDTALRRVVVLPPPPRRPPYDFRLLQQWEGTVTAISQEEFTADLRDLTDPTRPREEAAFDIEEVSPGDRELLAPGAVFRWSIGYRTSATGQRERVSHLYFVRIPGWRRTVVAEIQERAEVLRGQLSSHANRRSTASG